MKIDKKSRIFVAGHRGMVGSAIYRVLKEKGFQNILIKTKRIYTKKIKDVILNQWSQGIAAAPIEGGPPTNKQSEHIAND